MGHEFKNDFQTPPEVCRYMASLIGEARTVLEPTKGKGNLVKAIQDYGYHVTAPDDYFLLGKDLYFDAVCMNPPFSLPSLIIDNAPSSFKDKGMKVGYRILTECMERTNKVIALMPWFTISDSDVRLRYLKKYGLVSLTALPRKTFEYARIQTVIIELRKNYTGPTEFKVFEFEPKIKSAEEMLQQELF